MVASHVFFVKECNYKLGVNGIKPDNYKDIDLKKLGEVLEEIEKAIKDKLERVEEPPFDAAEQESLQEERLQKKLGNALIPKPFRMGNILFEACRRINKAFSLKDNGKDEDILYELKSCEYLYLSTTYLNENPIIVCADIKNDGKLCFIDINSLKITAFIAPIS